MTKVYITEQTMTGSLRGEARIVMSDPLQPSHILFDQWLPATLRCIQGDRYEVTLDRELGVFGADWNVEPNCWRPNDQK